MGNHFIKKCYRCKKVINQCRCPGPKKEEWGICKDCTKPHDIDPAAVPQTAYGAGKKYVEDGWEELKPQLKAIEEELHGIKRCPFCGHGTIEVAKHLTSGQYYAWCEGCGVTLSGCSSSEAVIKAWNERADTKDDSIYNGGNKW